MYPSEDNNRKIKYSVFPYIIKTLSLNPPEILQLCLWFQSYLSVTVDYSNRKVTCRYYFITSIGRTSKT